MNISVIAFGVGLLGIGLFIGYFVSTYRSRQSASTALAAFPESNPLPVMRIGRNGPSS